MNKKQELLALASEVPKSPDMYGPDVPTLIALIGHLAKDVEAENPLSAYFLELAREALLDPYNPDFRAVLNRLPDVKIRN